MTPSEQGQTPSQVALSVCQKHMNQPLLFYCSTCMVPICMNCTVLDHDKNSGHHIDDIASVVKSNNVILNRKLELVDKGLENYNSNLNMLKTEMTNLETVKSITMKQIDETFNQLKEKLQQRAELLKEEVEQSYHDRKHHIISHAQIVKNGAAELNECKFNIQSGLDNKDIGNAIALTKSIKTIGKVDQLCDEANKLINYEPSYIQFNYEHGLQTYVKAIQHLGETKCKMFLPSNISSNVPKCTAGISSKVNIQVKDGNNILLPNFPISATITYAKSDEKNILKPKSQEKGIYTFEFRPKFCGAYKLCVQFSDHPIWGTEKDIVVYPNNPVLKIGGGVTEDTANSTSVLFHPTSVAVSSQGNIYVADMGNKRIHVFNDKGESINTFAVGGSEFTTYDVAINHATEELICSRIGPNETGLTIGDTLRIFGLQGEKRNQFSNREMKRAMFLDVNSKGQIIVTDCVQNNVYIYSKEGVPVKKFGSLGTKQGQFNFPTAIAIGKDDVILIADTKNNRIQIFNKHGKFISQIGPSLDNCNGHIEIQAPRGLTADSYSVFVADSCNRILILKYNGSLTACIGSEGDAINEPYNLALTGDDHVLVADFKNNCVKKYRYK